VDIRWGSAGRASKDTEVVDDDILWLISWLRIQILWRSGEHYYMAISSPLPACN